VDDQCCASCNGGIILCEEHFFFRQKMIGVLVLAVTVLAALAYATLLMVSYFAFLRLKTHTAQATVSRTVAVVVAARNEEQNIPQLLRALEAQQCDFSFELIIVDDASADRTLQLVQAHWPKRFQLRAIRNHGMGKKDALTTGIHSTTAEIILVTDADCVPDARWVQRMSAQFTDEQCCFAAGMIRPEGGDEAVAASLITETIFLQVVSAGMFAMKNPVMCNGASMAFTRKFFTDVQGFTNDVFASGDDVLLLQKAKRYRPACIRWVKDDEAMVQTPVTGSLKEAIVQRHRWLSKLKAYSDPLLQVAGPVFLCMQLLLPLALLSIPVFGITDNPLWPALIIKIAVELLLLSLAASCFRATSIIILFPASAVVYCIISLGAVFRLIGGDVEWKGRTWKQGKVR
jgi:cellulose synthase/poly-beta-1,6-N-acetylglucosamine synthase-like glycosyltransferase